MNKFTKISASVLFSFFLVACDKPAESTKAEAPKAETAKVEAPTNTATSDVQGVEDFKKFVEWNQTQETALASFQAELQQKLSSQDKAQIEEGLKAFTVKVNDVLKSLDALDIKNVDVVAFKAKTKESLQLSNDLISESVKAMENPTAETQKLIQEKTEKLMQVGTELQKLQAELHQKFGAK